MSNNMGFTFGAAPSPATAAALSAGGGAPAPPFPSHGVGVGAAVASTATTTAPPSSIATIPPFQELFPRMEIQSRVEECLSRYKKFRRYYRTNRPNDRSSVDTSDDSVGGGAEGGFAASELTRLLSTASTPDNTAIPNAIGRYLANPTSILNFSSGNSTNSNETLRRELLQSANRNVIHCSDHDIVIASTACVTITTNCDNRCFYTNANNDIQNAQQQQQQQQQQLTALIPPISQEVLQLAQELHLTEVQALCLYVKANEEVMMRKTMEEENEVDVGGEVDDEDEFVTMLIEGGKVGFQKCQQRHDRLPNQQRTAAAAGPPTTKTSRTIQTARRIFFSERSALLSTVYNLIRHRVEAYSDIISSGSGRNSSNDDDDDDDDDGRNNGGGGRAASTITKSTSAVLIATDQLINFGLVDNLIKTVRELSALMEDIAKGLRSRSYYVDNNGIMQQQQQQSQSTSFGSGSLFGSSFTSTTTSTSQPSSSSTTTTTILSADNKNLDMEYALLGFTQLQRQIASECLFYLAYHTQLSVEEVVSIIDLIKDLTNGSSSGNGGGGGSVGLPLLDPLLNDVPSPYLEDDGSIMSIIGGGSGGNSMTMTPNNNAASAATSSWYLQQQHLLQQQQQPSPYGGGGGGWNQQPLLPIPKLKDPKEWNDELINNLWGRGQPQLLQCVSTLLMSIVCAFDSRHVLVNRDSHGPNSFGVGNSLFPPPQDHHHDGVGGGLLTGAANNSNTQALSAIHSRLDPNSQSAEESWQRRDVWGILLISYALLLRPAASQLVSPRGSPQHLQRSPPLGGGGFGGDGVDVKGTFSKCLMVASQLKSLTFARLSLIPSFGMPSTMPSSSSSSQRTTSDDASTYDFFVSIFAEFVAQYIDALCHTGNIPITRKEWYDEELNLAQSEWMEKDQKRQFGMWAGHAVEEDIGGPRSVNVMDRPDCLEDVFALISCICACNADGAQAFWNTVEEQQDVGNGKLEIYVVLAPSRCLRMLDLIQAESDSALFVYLSFLSSLALSGGTDDTEGSNGASMVHSFLAGIRTINSHSERHMHFNWNNVMSAIRWYAEQLSPEEGDDSSNKKVSSDRIRRTNSTSDTPESSTSYYYGAGGSDAANTSYDNSSTSSPIISRQGTSSSSYSGVDTKQKELDDVGRSTLMSLLCLISNVATRSAAAREFILSIQLPAIDSDATGGSYQDGSLEILFSLLTVPIPPEIQGLAFMAIANLIRANPTEDTPMISGESKKSPAALRAWELVEICQFIPIKLLSQYSSYAAGTSATTSMSMFGRSSGDLPATFFPRTSEYMMIYQLEHVEAEVGVYPATEGFLFLLSTLVKYAGCPSNLGSQWRLRPGCAPYIEYVTDFVLPRATGLAKNVKSLPFASVADECRLINRAIEVVESVLVRYVVPPVSEKKTFDEIKLQYNSDVNAARTELGLAPIISDIFCSVEDFEEEDMNAAIQDFSNGFVYSQDGAMNPTAAGQMLEASFGKKIPFPKTPGFSILANLLSTNKGLLFKIIMKLLAEHGGPSGVQECNKLISSESLATSLFRETPPILACTKKSMDLHAQQQLNVLDKASYKEALSSLQQSMIRPIHPLLLISCSDGGFSDRNEKGASLGDAVLWRERTLVMCLRIICAAAAREEAFMRSLKITAVSLSIVPTLLFKGPIHGSMMHKFVDEHKVNTSKMSQLLTTSSVAFHGTNRSNDILPVISDYVGYNACSLVNPQGIATSAFSIISYISYCVPHTECIRSLCGDDINGVGLTRAFSKGLSLPVPEADNDSNLRDVILDLMLSNIGIDSTSSLNVSLMMLGLSGSRQNCFNVILDLVADVDFVINPTTSSAATKCFELIFRVCELGSRSGLPALARSQQIRLTEKLRRSKFWHSQAVRYLGERGDSVPSILYEVSRYFQYDQGQDIKVTNRNNDVLHSIAWLLKGLAVETRSLINVHGLMRKSQFHSLLWLLLSHQDRLLLSALINLPLGQAKDGTIWQKLHSWEPSADALHKSKVPMIGVVDVCAGYEVIDIDIMLENLGRQQSKDSAREWAVTWNMFVQRSCACSHVCQAWSDLARTVLICYSVFLNTTEQIERNMAMNKRLVLEMICAILLRLQIPSHFDALGQYSFLSGKMEDIVTEDVAAECAKPLCNAVLSLTEVFLDPSNVEVDTNGSEIVEEDTARVCMLIIGAISSCASIETGLSSNNDLCGALLSCALTRVLTTSEPWCIISENMPSNLLEICANAISYLFHMAASPVYASQDRYSNAHDAQRGDIALAARSGLSSFFGHLNSLETNDSMVELFCSKIFTLASIRKSATRLAQLIGADDKYVTDLLQQVVLLHADGAQLLAKSGITSELLSFAHSYATEEKKYLSSHMGVSGTASLKSPPVLNGHLSLLNVLLSSPLPALDRNSLSIVTMKIMKEYSNAGERLLQSYPADAYLTMKFLETLCLTFSSLKKEAGSAGLENSPLHVDENLLKLERSVLGFAYHLSAFPFPSELLPPLPIGLINVEEIHASQMKTLATSLMVTRTWWDQVSDSGAPLPTPPTGSSDAGLLKRFNVFNSLPNSTFSVGKYQHAIHSAKCLEISLMSLLNRVGFVAHRNMDTFSIDAVAIAKGLCRCSDASRAIEDRLASMKSHPEEDITTLLKSSIFNPNSQGEQSLLSQSLQLEKEYLFELGSCLGQCAEKLVSLALQDARRMSEYGNDQEWAYFVGAVTPALDHTQVETKGIGCVFDDTNAEKNKLNAQALRQEMETMKAKFLLRQ